MGLMGQGLVMMIAGMGIVYAFLYVLIFVSDWSSPRRIWLHHPHRQNYHINDRHDHNYHRSHFYGDMPVGGFHCSLLLQAF